jgi:uncharacterized integral membrane protein (TIGR00697 family)
MKVWTGGRLLWTRTIGSTIVGEGLDSLLFVTIAFWGIIPPEFLVTTILTQWLFKVSYEVLATPVTYSVVGFLKRQEGLEVFDQDTTFNPLAITES